MKCHFVHLFRYKPLAEAHDFNVLDRQNINFGLLPIVFFTFGYGVLCMLAAFLELDVLFLGKVLSLFKGWVDLLLYSPDHKQLSNRIFLNIPEFEIHKYSGLNV